jgi:hypothetical protein
VRRRSSPEMRSSPAPPPPLFHENAVVGLRFWRHRRWDPNRHHIGSLGGPREKRPAKQNGRVRFLNRFQPRLPGWSLDNLPIVFGVDLVPISFIAYRCSRIFRVRLRRQNGVDVSLLKCNGEGTSKAGVPRCSLAFSLTQSSGALQPDVRSSCVTKTAPYSGLFTYPKLVCGNIIISNDRTIETTGRNYSFDTAIGLDFYLQCALPGRFWDFFRRIWIKTPDER